MTVQLCRPPWATRRVARTWFRPSRQTSHISSWVKSARSGAMRAATVAELVIGAVTRAARRALRRPSSSEAAMRSALAGPTPGCSAIAAGPSRATPSSPPARSRRPAATSADGAPSEKVPSRTARRSASPSEATPFFTGAFARSGGHGWQRRIFADVACLDREHAAGRAESPAIRA